METRATLMNRSTLMRIGIIAAIMTVLVAIDGIYMIIANYHPDDTANNGIGNFHPSDGVTVLIAAALLLIFTVVTFVLANRSQTTVVSTPATVPASTTEDTKATAQPEATS